MTSNYFYDDYHIKNMADGFLDKMRDFIVSSKPLVIRPQI